ncbi:VOC family protein [Streptacidiphilus monticola]
MDLNAPDLESARRFYGAALGWEFQDNGPEYGHYTTCLWKGKPVAALMPPPPGAEGLRPAWNVYLSAPELEVTVERVEQGGGTVAMGPHEIPGAGRLAFAFDPQGASFGLWQAGGHTGAGLHGEPGAMTWNELNTTAGEEADAFYRGCSPTSSSRSATASTSTTAAGGCPARTPRLRTQPRDRPQHPGRRQGQAVLVGLLRRRRRGRDGAPDRRARRQRAARPLQLPFGRLCAVLDPSGAHFTVITLAR